MTIQKPEEKKRTHFLPRSLNFVINHSAAWFPHNTNLSKSLCSLRAGFHQQYLMSLRSPCSQELLEDLKWHVNVEQLSMLFQRCFSGSEVVFSWISMFIPSNFCITFGFTSVSWWWQWWWWIVFVVWLTSKKCLVLFPAGTTARDP